MLYTVNPATENHPSTPLHEKALLSFPTTEILYCTHHGTQEKNVVCLIFSCTSSMPFIPQIILWKSRVPLNRNIHNYIFCASTIFYLSGRGKKSCKKPSVTVLYHQYEFLRVFLLVWNYHFSYAKSLHLPLVKVPKNTTQYHSILHNIPLWGHTFSLTIEIRENSSQNPPIPPPRVLFPPTLLMLLRYAVRKNERENKPTRDERLSKKKTRVGCCIFTMLS